MIRLAAALVVPAALILASAAGCVSERIGVDESHPAVLDARLHPGHGLDQADVHAIRAEVYERRRSGETSLMAQGIYASAVRESSEVVQPDQA